MVRLQWLQQAVGCTQPAGSNSWLSALRGQEGAQPHLWTQFVQRKCKGSLWERQLTEQSLSLH